MREMLAGLLALAVGLAVAAETLPGCAAGALPLAESFADPGLPTCWSQTVDGSLLGASWQLLPSNQAGGQAANEMGLAAPRQPDNHTGITRLVSPELDVAGHAKVQLAFTTRFEASEHFAGCAIGIQSSSDGIAFVDEPWRHDSGDGPIPAGTRIVVPILKRANGRDTDRLWVAWHTAGNHNYFDHWLVDDVEIAAVDCFAPLDLLVTAISDQQANLAWADYNETGTRFQLIIGPNGFDPEAAGTLIDDLEQPTYAFADLSPATCYDVQVRAIGPSQAVSAWSAKASFTTLPGPVAVFPFVETFEPGSPSREQWTQVCEQGRQPWEFGCGNEASIPEAHAGATNAIFRTAGDGRVTKLVSPMLDLTQADGLELSFWYALETWAGDRNRLKVYFRPAPEQPWTLLAEYADEAPAWTPATLALPTPSPRGQIAFEGIDHYGYPIVVDSMVVGERVGCPSPVDLQALAVGHDHAELGWQGYGDAWEVRWDEAGFDPDSAGNQANLTAPSCQLTGLKAETAYQFYVRTVCGEARSEWSGPAHFATTAVPVERILELAAGWNAISLPVTPADRQVETVFAKDGRAATVHTGPLWGWQANRLAKVDELQAGQGYWLFCRADTQVTIVGLPAAPVATLAAGWNLVGTPTPVADPGREGRIKGPIWRWDGRRGCYLPVDPTINLPPGHACWIFASEAFELNPGR